MLTSKKVINAINEQIGYEFSASLHYYCGALCCGSAPAIVAGRFPAGGEEKGYALRFI